MQPRFIRRSNGVAGEERRSLAISGQRLLVLTTWSEAGE